MSLKKFTFEPLDLLGGGQVAGQRQFEAAVSLFDAREVSKKEAEILVEEEVVKREQLYKETFQFTQDDLAESKRKGFEEGYAKGYEAAKNASDDLGVMIEKALQSIVNQLGNLEQKVEIVAKKDKKAVVEVAYGIAKKIAGNMVSKDPVSAMMPAIEKAFSVLVDEPVLTFSVAPGLAAMVKEKVAAIRDKTLYTGEIVVQEKDNVAMGDCVVEWNNGLLKGDKAKRLAAVDQILSQF